MPPLAPRIVEKGLASDRVVIETVVAKYCDHLPLYRQEAMLEREAGVEISRATLDGWVMRVGELLQPVVGAMRADLLRASYIQADETIVPVQMHDGRGADHQAYLWQYGTPGRRDGVRFSTGPRTRWSGEIPQRLERDFANRRLSGLRSGGRTGSDSRGLLGALSRLRHYPETSFRRPLSSGFGLRDLVIILRSSLARLDGSTRPRWHGCETS